MFIKTLAAAAFLASRALGLEAIHAKGTKFFYENGTQFYIQGVAYQQHTGAAGKGATDTKYADPLADPDRCKQDVPLLRELGTNVIRTYAIDPKADHSECMGLLEEAGIYVISDLGEPSLSIETDNPSWDVSIFQRYKDVIDELSNYDNVLGFFAGNEVSTNKTNTKASAFVKAAVRDTKAYIKANKQRPMYVGYAANDDAAIRVEIANYFNCGENQDEAIDFWGYNIYQWCGKSSFEQSGYSKQVDFFSTYSVPVFFAEYGCNTVGGAEGRTFDDTRALFSSQMTGVFSGGIVYMFFEEENDYGLVELDGDKAVKMKNFDNLAEAISEVNPDRAQEDQYSPSNTPQPCPAISDSWEASSKLPPTPDQETCDCMFATLACVPAPSLDVEEYGDIFGFVCGSAGSPCSGIRADADIGVYGAYSMCSPEHKLGYVLDRYYKNQKSQASACDFDGKATIKSATQVKDSCNKKLASASAVNDVAATATGSAKDDDSGVAGLQPLTFGSFAVGAYLVAALGFGAGMIIF